MSSLIDVFHWHHLQKTQNKTLLCYVFYHLVKQVARPAHKKKARMARTRSDFLTRGTFADGEGDTEEDDYDDIIEPLLSLDQPSHSELGPAPSLGQASHSDSEMVILQQYKKNRQQANLMRIVFANLKLTFTASSSYNGLFMGNLSEHSK